MQITLYHYVHCPFCVRVRMGLGFLKAPFESQVIAYDDESTPVKLAGKKMLPIATVNGKTLNESLEILDLVDEKKVLKVKEISEDKNFESLLSSLGETVHSLAMPQWIFTQEFTESSRTYFMKKKEVKRGPFKELVAQRSSFIERMNKDLENLPLQPFFESDKMGLKDIMLAAHLWGLYVVPEFQFSEKVHTYLQNIKQKCQFNYHEDYWR